MPKRRRSNASFGSVNEVSDEDYMPSKSSRRGYKAKHGRKTANQCIKTGLDTAKPLEPDDDPSMWKMLHSQSMHTISSSSNMRDALTKWFDGVRDVRGMPWRKPYDPYLGTAERAQRAYEVYKLHRTLLPDIDGFAGMDLRNYAAADPSDHSNSILSPMDAAVSSVL